MQAALVTCMPAAMQRAHLGQQTARSSSRGPHACDVLVRTLSPAARSRPARPARSIHEKRWPSSSEHCRPSWAWSKSLASACDRSRVADLEELCHSCSSDAHLSLVDRWLLEAHPRLFRGSRVHPSWCLGPRVCAQHGMRWRSRIPLSCPSTASQTPQHLRISLSSKVSCLECLSSSSRSVATPVRPPAPARQQQHQRSITHLNIALVPPF
jgi:hypothetical protein